MDLQTERRLEQFLRLSDFPVDRVETRMEFSFPPFRLYIEYTNGRVLLSLARKVEACRRIQTLKTLLGCCQPACTQGVPLRAYALGDHQVLSCGLVPGSDVNQWIRCLQTMRRLLATHVGEAR
jgi:type III secretion system chaperone SycN